jgi:2-polyprenyl-3-methyl-5-hydroxy-6-metoxy-1,4-benzoquinol methylase
MKIQKSISFFIKAIKYIMRTIGHWFDFFATIYLRWSYKRQYKKQRFVELNERPVEFSFVFRKITEIWPKTVLDVGTGMTALPSVLRTTGLEVTAIDNIKDYWPIGMVNRHYYIINDDICNTKVNKTFDVITCISVLEHIKDHRSAIKSMYKLLNPGGVLILTCPFTSHQYIENVYALPESQVKGLPPFTTQSFSDKERQEWMKDSPFDLEDEEYWQYFDGEFWTCGNILKKIIKVTKDSRHQICCMTLRRPD